MRGDNEISSTPFTNNEASLSTSLHCIILNIFVYVHFSIAETFLFYRHLSKNNRGQIIIFSAYSSRHRKYPYVKGYYSVV
jgi:hypothetical protein